MAERVTAYKSVTLKTADYTARDAGQTKLVKLDPEQLVLGVHIVVTEPMNADNLVAVPAWGVSAGQEVGAYTGQLTPTWIDAEQRLEVVVSDKLSKGRCFVVLVLQSFAS